MIENKPEIDPSATKQAFVYEQLVPEPRHTKVSSEQELHEQYIWRLSGLIDKVSGDPEDRADTLVFLDKSARPLAWMMRTFWDDIAPQEVDPETGEMKTIPMPDMKFVNIDRLAWRSNPGQEMSDGGERPVTDRDVKGLRAIFNHSKKNELDGKRVVIIDEQSESGDTLKVAKKIFSRAFPSADISGEAWISHPSVTDPITGDKKYLIQDIPVWYPLRRDDKLPEDITGRGVYNPVPPAQRSVSFKQRYAEDPEASSQFLSSRPKIRRTLSDADFTKLNALQAQFDSAEDPAQQKELAQEIESLYYHSVDRKSLQLRREIGRMLIDFKAGHIHPSIVTDREEIRGVPADEYREQARAKKELRNSKN